MARALKLLRLGLTAAAMLPAAATVLQDRCFAATRPNPAATDQSKKVPKPHQVHARGGPVAQSKTALVALGTAPFPYDGKVGASDHPFLDVEFEGRMGHSSHSGHILWADEKFNDNRVLLHIPKGFDARKPGLIVVYFHGHGATLERDVLQRQRVPDQVTGSGANVVLVAPQFAVDAADSSVGKFWKPGAFAQFLGEAGKELAKLHGDKHSVRAFASMPVVFVAYSGGYAPAAWCATQGGLKKRLRGVVLLDALYGEMDKFVAWIQGDRSAFFVSAFLGSTQDNNVSLERILSERNVAYSTDLGPQLQKGSISIIQGGYNVSHRDLVTHAWVDYPIRDLLLRLKGYMR